MKDFISWVLAYQILNLVIIALVLSFTEYPYTFERKQWHHVFQMIFSFLIILWIMTIL